VKNGDEGDVDCGGVTSKCTLCGPTRTCNVNADCWDNQCISGACGSTFTSSIGGAGNPPFDATGDGSKLVLLEGNGSITVNRTASLAAIARYLWVSNSGEGTVSKIDTTTFTEVARYCTAPGCNADPSRASVSLDGNAGIANRANYFYNGVTHPERASAVSIAGDVSRCIDRNGNGKIDTNVGAGPVPAQFQWPAGQATSPDECVLWFAPLTTDRTGATVASPGTLPRSATFDAKAGPNGQLSSNFYVGLYGSHELVQIDAQTGLIVAQVALPNNAEPYSSAFDPSGNLWIRDASNNTMLKIDTSNPALPAVAVGGVIPCSYAVTADARGYIYAAGSNCIGRMDGTAASPTWETVSLPNSCFARGPSVDANFDVWVPDTCYGGYRVDSSRPIGQGMTVKSYFSLPAQGPQGNYILGTAIGSGGKAYFVNTESSNGGNLQEVGGPNGTVYEVDPSTLAAGNPSITPSFLRVGTTPYTYSDLSGSMLALSAPATGSLNMQFPAYCASKATWQAMTWIENVPGSQTNIAVRYRAGKDQASLAQAQFIQAGVEPPAITQPLAIKLPQGTDPSILEVQFILTTASVTQAPTLSNVSVTYSCPP
jgi:streptogramin lyase